MVVRHARAPPADRRSHASLPGQSGRPDEPVRKMLDLGPHRGNTQGRGCRMLTNAQIAELLARAAEEAEPGSNRERALGRASRAAFFWPVEAARLRVLRAIEMNLSPEGVQDMEPQALAKLDLVLAAFHSKLRPTEDQTDRYLRALRNPTFNVLAHPRGRVFNRRRGLSADWPRVFEAAAEEGKALEIDAHPSRQDLDVGLLELAREAGMWISIGTDAHLLRELRHIEFGVALAIRSGFPRDRILNYQPLESVLRWAHELPAT